MNGIEPKVSLEIKLSAKSGISRGNTSAITDLETKQIFMLTPEGGDYMINENFRLVNLDELSQYLADEKLVVVKSG